MDPVRAFERPLGARPRAEGGFEFRVWAPGTTEGAIVLGDPEQPDDAPRAP